MAIVLCLVAVAAVSSSVVAQRWSDEASRAREIELLRVGDAYAGALAAYAAVGSGAERRYPQSLDQLLLDARTADVRRHIRRLYVDPTTGQNDWLLVRDARGGITGVRSRSDRPTWSRVSQRLRHTDLEAANRQTQWLFTPRGSQ